MTDDLGTLAATYFRAWKAKDFARVTFDARGFSAPGS